MKRILIFSTILILLQPFKLSAQKAYAIDKGSIIIGGSLSYTSTGNKDQVIDRIQTITICPGCLFFIVPHLAIGGELKLIHTDYSEYSVKCYGIGPAISYYFGKKMTKNIRFYQSTI